MEWQRAPFCVAPVDGRIDPTFSGRRACYTTTKSALVRPRPTASVAK